MPPTPKEIEPGDDEAAEANEQPQEDDGPKLGNNPPEDEDEE